MSSDRQPIFYEVQRLQIKRLPVLLAIPPVLMLMLVIWQVILGHPWGRHPMSNAAAIGWTIFLWLIYFRLVTIRLVTEVRTGEVSVAMRGFWRKRLIAPAEIRAAQTVTYDAARDWGGYGIRVTPRGTAYIAGGNRGVRLNLIKGVILIGSGRPEELVSAINRQVSNVSSEARPPSHPMS